ncbi:hypothetical protein ANANG_G00044970 [Anguilla anguilla]|uniref:Uncharacterized protein n=1 Tax=Anguilla anguilla TaxID=7936 RepID=A0A9D3MUP3_ANGAN|nr:hypothetical protein ANANG_G00044970 [Anguilla anguilla]
MKPNVAREKNSSIFGFHGQLTLVSYLPSKGKAVLALSTMHQDTKVEGIAAFIIWMGNFPDWMSSEGSRRRRIFLKELGHALVMPNIKRRAQTPTLQTSIRAAMLSMGVSRPGTRMK